MSYSKYERLFSKLNLHKVKGHYSPHKVALLLAVTDLIENGTLTENRIEYSDSLIDAYKKRYNKLRRENDSKDSKPFVPYFHLRQESFWSHSIKPGHAESYEKLSTVQQRGHINCVAYSYLNDDLFELLNNGFVREKLRQALFQNPIKISDEYHSELDYEIQEWRTYEEFVEEYFDILGHELRIEAHDKGAHRRALNPRIHYQTADSESIRQKISAVLIELGFTYISGYAPRFDNRDKIRDVVLSCLARRISELDKFSTSAVSLNHHNANWDSVLDPEIPELIPFKKPPKRKFLESHIDYSQREARNRSLGAAGEKFVVLFEQFRLRRAKRKDLASEVEWSSKERGDGIGYDVRSFQIRDDGVAKDEEKFIEVKTTKRGKHQPFYISANEIEFSRENKDSYSLYRVYNFQSIDKRRLFQMPGQVENHVSLKPILHFASFSKERSDEM